MRNLNAFVNGVALKKDKLVYCEMHVRSNPVRLQVDCGATVSFIARSHIGDTQLITSLSVPKFKERVASGCYVVT